VIGLTSCISPTRIHWPVSWTITSGSSSGLSTNGSTSGASRATCFQSN